MTRMISVASGFQSSVNISYDLNDDSKLKKYIPTKSSLGLLQDILLSTRGDSVDRSRILIGPYGKGKSHIVLMIMSILMKKDLALFEKMMPVIKMDNEELYHLIKNYYTGNIKLLPVVISGTSNSISQAFMLALQQTLGEYELNDIMPETSYKAALRVIDRWKDEFPETYAAFKEKINEPIEVFVENLEDYDPARYETFEKLYPQMTSGSVFNPFVGFGVIEMYEEAVKNLSRYGYSGIYVIYDEFSKYLENHISDATKNDTKVLQDFAEKCGRSGTQQLHLMLISHKEITSYIDRASKQMVDGWRGVSERFNHIYLNNNFSQTYEIIASAIEKDPVIWEKFKEKHSDDFMSLFSLYEKHPMFSDIYSDGLEQIIYDCYPLHPVSTYILPRLSERVAQNERTLFTYISAQGESTLYTYVNQHDDSDFGVVTPDSIYDYFEPLLKQEVYSGNLHRYYVLTTSILRRLEEGSLEAKIIKAIALIYILEQFEKLSPTMDELIGIYSTCFSPEVIRKAILGLIEEKYVIYHKKSNNYLQLKETSGVNIQREIADLIEKQSAKFDLKTTLNEFNYDNYMYPSRYNDEKDMTRFFQFEFIDAEEVSDDVDWRAKSSQSESDGTIYAVIPKKESDIASIVDSLKRTSEGSACIFVVPRSYTEIEKTIREMKAVNVLLMASSDDPILHSDYEVIYDDLREVILNYINGYTHPENNATIYIFDGKTQDIKRKAELTSLMSDICDSKFGRTPAINNEVINRNEITGTTRNSRNKIIAALLRNELEPNLGLTGTGQEVSIMRSTLVNTGVLKEENGIIVLDLEPQDEDLKHMLSVIMDFILRGKTEKECSFEDLYRDLVSDKKKIGMRKGLIPIYLSAVFHQFSKDIVINDRQGQVPLTVDTVVQINAEPSMFTFSYLGWDEEKEAYVSALEEVFKDFVSEGEKTVNSYDYILSAMRRWYMSLPKYSKDLKKLPNGERIPADNRRFIQELKSRNGSYEELFIRIPEVFGREESYDDGLVEIISHVKTTYDTALDSLKAFLIDKVKEGYSGAKESVYKKMTVTSVVKDWCDRLDPEVFNQLFEDGTEKCLTLFKDSDNNEDYLITSFGKLVTGLRIEDWDDTTVEVFLSRMLLYKRTAEEFKKKTATSDAHVIAEGYMLGYVNESGEPETKYFNRVEGSKRGELLHNSIISQIKAMGQSISEQEKRQILMDILREIC